MNTAGMDTTVTGRRSNSRSFDHLVRAAARVPTGGTTARNCGVCPTVRVPCRGRAPGPPEPRQLQAKRAADRAAARRAGAARPGERRATAERGGAWARALREHVRLLSRPRG